MWYLEMTYLQIGITLRHTNSITNLKARSLSDHYAFHLKDRENVKIIVQGWMEFCEDTMTWGNLNLV